MAILCKCLGAHKALVWAFPRVGPLVPSQVDVGRERLLTRAARVGLLSCVAAPVLGDLIAVLELLPTDITFIGFLSCNTHGSNVTLRL